jgi:hypothetical protein
MENYPEKGWQINLRNDKFDETKIQA